MNSIMTRSGSLCLHRHLTFLALVVLFLGVLAVPFGLAQVSTTPISLAPPTAQAGFGFGLASGDINGDGNADIVTGSTQQKVGNASNAGKAYVYLGGNPPNPTPIELVSPNPEGEARFGWYVTIGDLNGDGLGDIIISSILAGGGSNGKGAVYVFFGSQNFVQKAADITIAAPSALNSKAYFGWSLGVGKVNGDNIDDLVIGAEDVTVGGRSEAGAAYLVFGAATFTGAIGPALQSPTPQQSGAFGNSVAVGDVNHDGFGDVIVGSPGQNVGNTQAAGQVFIFFGGTTPSTTSNLTLSLPSPGSYDRHGFSVASGDVNGDGIADVIAGASQPGSPPFGQPGPGKVSVFFGGVPMDATLDSTISQTPPKNGSGFGQVLAIADINKDGKADILIGVPLATLNNKSAAGELDIVLGANPFDNTIDLVLTAPTPTASAELGLAVALGDVNGDTRPDVIGGMPAPPGFGGGGGGAGVILVYFAQ